MQRYLENMEVLYNYCAVCNVREITFKYPNDKNSVSKAIWYMQYIEDALEGKFQTVVSVDKSWIRGDQ
tara:strand:- start:689 stop:892 length:204 start_codon:yes stop_codon:yes gene_type:complete